MSYKRFPTRLGNYILLDRLNSGGMAEVYRAKEVRNDGLGQIIAIKRMAAEMARDAQLVQMFVDEAKLTSALVHPNIGQTYELGRVDDFFYIAMELIWGKDLAAIMKLLRAQRRSVPVGIACYVVSKVAEALDYAHDAKGPDGRSMRVVHRDVSPHNVLIDYEGQVKLIDFGVAKADAHHNQTQAGMIKGKPSYMAPEQAMGGVVDRRTDIFALGILLYELISGERLYDGSSTFSIFSKVVNTQPTPLTDVSDAPKELEAIVARCLAKNPTERYETAAQLNDALALFRIGNRHIVGRKEVRDFMRDIYPQAEYDMREKLASYRNIKANDCIDGSANHPGYTQILVKSDFMPDTVVPRPTPPDDETWVYEFVPADTKPMRALADTQPVKPMRTGAPEPHRIARPVAPTQIFEKPIPRWPTPTIIAFIFAIAAVIIIAARSRNQTAMELFESLLHPPSVAQQQDAPSRPRPLDTKTLVAPLAPRQTLSGNGRQDDGG